MQVKKYSGELAPFDESALRRSLQRSGAKDNEVDLVYRSIKDKLYDGISTHDLYQLAFEQLAKQKDSYAARYSLKRALRGLGPEGFYFEKWITRLFQEDGYQAMTGTTIQGKAVTHEIDVIALKGDRLFAIECKFRNDPDAKISVTTPMYFKSRKEDISGIDFEFFNQKRQFTDGMMVTNAYFTSDSIAFAKCYDIKLLAWNYPENNSIKVLVDDLAEYPITCLTSLTDQQKNQLLKADCILVKDLLSKPSVLQQLEIQANKQKRILKEAKELVEETPAR